MPNKNYVKGRRKEYKICNEFKDAGFDIVQRTAGSHSPIDVIAISRDTRTIFFIQSKPENHKLGKYEEEEWLNGEFKVEFVIR